MSRKSLFVNLSAPASGQDGVSEDRAKPVSGASRVRARPILGSPDLIPDQEARPIGVLGKSLDELNERTKRAEEIERRLTEGQVIVELDPDAIDPSFVSDRLPSAPEALTSLTEKIRDHGQLNPILVRPHPESLGRYQVAFGHRRLRVTKSLGMTVKAVVRPLSDEELVIAQGQENHEREDLSYIEKALFARKLGGRGFPRSTIMAAMSVYKSDLSNMLTVADKIPEQLISKIGAAPGIGRRGWIELAGLMSDRKVKAAVESAARETEFEGLDSDLRFKRILTAAKPRPSSGRVKTWASPSGEALAKVSEHDDRVILTINRQKSPRFAEFVLSRLRELYLEFEDSSKERP
ncbi:MAG: plasmid partitioning protein RepB [Methylorubrum rhodinum]|uniref:plasmid partitioning protein RepB n=1 Tax=Methylorubrum rhodinum TaxID=29428 RepID=UPI003BAE37A8